MCTPQRQVAPIEQAGVEELVEQPRVARHRREQHERRLAAHHRVETGLDLGRVRRRGGGDAGGGHRAVLC
jgi:hypothetical protein